MNIIAWVYVCTEELTAMFIHPVGTFQILENNDFARAACQPEANFLEYYRFRQCKVVSKLTP